MKIKKYRYSFAGEVYQIPVFRIATNKARGLFTSGEYETLQQGIDAVIEEFDLEPDLVNEWALEMGMSELVGKSQAKLFTLKERKAHFKEHLWDII